MDELTPEQVQQILSLYTTGQRGDDLTRRRAQLVEQRGRPKQRYSTWGGAIAGGLGDVLGDVNSYMREGKLDTAQTENTAQGQTGIQAIADAMRTPKRPQPSIAAAPATGAELEQVTPASDLATALERRTQPTATAAPAVPMGAPRPRPAAISPAPVGAAPGPDPLMALQKQVGARGEQAFFSDPANARLAPLWRDWDMRGAAELHPPSGTNPEELKLGTARAAQLLRAALAGRR
jgi:hypothetical protein